MHEVPGRSMKGTTVKNRITAISLAATLALALTACGGDKPAASNPAASAQSTAPDAPAPSASIDTGEVKVDRLTDDEKRYVAALVDSAIKNGITESLSVMEGMSATEVQSEIVKRRAKCGTKEQHATEAEIQQVIDLFKGEIPEKNIRAHFTAKDKASDTYICK